jgi:hypothetical protein
MNCDMAFDLMTDADGSRSLALARHLDDCPRCRQMQATLAPALNFVTSGEAGESAHESAPPFAAAGSGGGRQPLVTAEALAVARHCAADLTARTDAPRVRLQRLVLKSLRYAAVFAAGLLLAFALFETRRGAVPGDAKKCMRHEAARNDAQRTAAEIRTLALSCAACHNPPENQHEENRTSSLESRRCEDVGWLERLISEGTLVASIEARPAPPALRIG